MANWVKRRGNGEQATINSGDSSARLEREGKGKGKGGSNGSEAGGREILLNPACGDREFGRERINVRRPRISVGAICKHSRQSPSACV